MKKVNDSKIAGKQQRSTLEKINPESYEELNRKYTIHGFKQYTLQYLKRMSTSDKSNLYSLLIVPAYPRSSLFSVLIYVCKLLHLNELEALQWSLCVESGNIDWKRSDLDHAIILLLTGFQVKV